MSEPGTTTLHDAPLAMNEVAFVPHVSEAAVQFALMAPALLWT